LPFNCCFNGPTMASRYRSGYQFPVRVRGLATPLAKDAVDPDITHASGAAKFPKDAPGLNDLAAVIAVSKQRMREAIRDGPRLVLERLLAGGQHRLTRAGSIDARSTA
jgi:hypothetical protein